MSPKDTPAGAGVRAAAADLVARVVEERVGVEEWLPRAAVAERDRALLAALVLGALRWHRRLPLLAFNHSTARSPGDVHVCTRSASFAARFGPT